MRKIWRMPVLLIFLNMVVALLTSRNVIFRFDLSNPRMIIEAAQSDRDMDLTSGGAIIIQNGVASTLTGDTSPTDLWYIPNPDNSDLDRVLRPQIVFRAITPESSSFWSNYQVRFSVIPTSNIQSQSVEVDGTDGIFVFLYYTNQDNLYVAGITKDGRLTIKRKATTFGGESLYALIAQEYVFDGTYEPNGNLLTPFEGANIVLTASILNLANGDVEITLLAEIFKNGEQVFSGQLSGIDSGNLVAQGGSRRPLGTPFYYGRSGIRLDSIEGFITEFLVTRL